MTKALSILMLLISSTDLLGQNRLDSLEGDWHLKKYFSYLKMQDIESWTPNGCKDYLTLSIHKKGKLRIIFTDHKDSFVFSGKIRSKNKRLKISNNIHELIYLGNLEKCISPGLREDIRGTLYRVYNFSVTGKQLTLYYNLPANSSDIKTMVLFRD